MGKKRIALEKLLTEKQNLDYKEQYQYVMDLLKDNKITPVKSAGTNGKSPALCNAYWIAEEKADEQEFLEELRFTLVPSISINYYLAHPEVYREERHWVLLLNRYLKEQKGRLLNQESLNERSFEIWAREKFLSKEQGKKILGHCGLDIEKLNVYATTEPLSYYSNTREVPQNLLILENKDTFYSMRRHLLEENREILGVAIGTLIYGAGKGILRSFADFDICVEPYMKHEKNRIYYFGDLDYEGIGIYENLARLCRERWEIIPFCPAYRAMLKKAETVEKLPDTKEQQNRNIRQEFFKWFTEKEQDSMTEILLRGEYIPQEILNIQDF